MSSAPIHAWYGSWPRSWNRIWRAVPSTLSTATLRRAMLAARWAAEPCSWSFWMWLPIRNAPSNCWPKWYAWAAMSKCWRCFPATTRTSCCAACAPGAADFLLEPFTAEQLEAVLAKVARLQPAAETAGSRLHQDHRGDARQRRLRSHHRRLQPGLLLEAHGRQTGPAGGPGSAHRHAFVSAEDQVRFQFPGRAAARP